MRCLPCSSAREMGAAPGACARAAPRRDPCLCHLLTTATRAGCRGRLPAALAARGGVHLPTCPLPALATLSALFRCNCAPRAWHPARALSLAHCTPLLPQSNKYMHAAKLLQPSCSGGKARPACCRAGQQYPFGGPRARLLARLWPLPARCSTASGSEQGRAPSGPVPAAACPEASRGRGARPIHTPNCIAYALPRTRRRSLRRCIACVCRAPHS
jgi:hypothetical protein